MYEMQTSLTSLKSYLDTGFNVVKPVFPNTIKRNAGLIYSDQNNCV